jgi:hypothetical protein
MPVIVVGTEKNFAALRPRLFSGSVSTKAAGEVLAAIQEANPHADLKSLEPGTVLEIPEHLAHVVVQGELSIDDTSGRAVAAVLDAGEQTIATLTASAEAHDADASAARKQLGKLLAGNELADAAGKDKAIAASLRAAQDAISAADSQAKARADAFEQAKAEWAAELAAIRTALPTPS